jgi:predicted transcriptional regulator
VRYAGSPMDQCPESNSCAHVWMLRNEAVLLCPVADDYFISIACDVHFFSEKRSLCNHRKLTVTNYAV